MLELILNKTSPKAIILRDVDSILCTGAIVAEEFFPDECYDERKVTSFVPEIYAIGEAFESLRNSYKISFKKEKNRDMMALIQGTNTKGDENFNITSNNLLQEQIHANNIKKSGLTLTLEEQNVLQGKDTHESMTSRAKTLAMRTIVRVTFVSLQSTNTLTELMPIKSAHIDGVTFIGLGGLRFVEELVRLGGTVEVPTSLNSQSVDRRRWKDLGVNPDFAANANRVGDAYLKLGCELSFTCAPYLIPTSTPSFGDQIMWGESNAVVYANSVLGARTEKYADYFDICAAIIGKIPMTGVHLEENRQPGIILDASDLVADIFFDEGYDTTDIDSFFPTMGWLCGNLSDGKVPLILGFDQIHSITDDDLKSFCAAYGTTGTAPLFHMAGVTPEASDDNIVKKMILSIDEGQTKCLGMHQLKESYETLNGFQDSADAVDSSAEKVDLVAFGNPHLSVSEIKSLVDLIQKDDKPKHENTEVLATLSRTIHERASKLGYIKILEDFGVKFVNDTCWCMMTDEPIIPPSKSATIMTNSAKYAHYGVGLTQRKLRFGSMNDCVSVAKDGMRHLNPCHNLNFPLWLKSSTRSFITLVKRVR